MSHLETSCVSLSVLLRLNLVTIRERSSDGPSI